MPVARCLKSTPRRSPSWVAPIAQFVDEQCIIFEDQARGSLFWSRTAVTVQHGLMRCSRLLRLAQADIHLLCLSPAEPQEENKLEYTECHKEFRQLIGLDMHLQGSGVGAQKRALDGEQRQ